MSFGLSGEIFWSRGFQCLDFGIDFSVIQIQSSLNDTYSCCIESVMLSPRVAAQFLAKIEDI